MTLNEIKSAIAKLPDGRIRTLTYGKTLKTRKGITDVVTKRTVMQVQFGVCYDNKKSTIEGRANGTLPAENQGLKPNQEWVDKYLIRNIQTGSMSVRISFVNNNMSTTEYKRNGVIVDKAEIVPLCLKSEVESRGPISVLDIGIDKIIDIK